MAEAAISPLPAEAEDQFQEETHWERFKDWVRTELVWYAGSFSFHLLGLSLLLLLPNFGGSGDQGDATWVQSNPNKEVAQTETEKLPPVDITEPDPIEPQPLVVDPT